MTGHDQSEVFDESVLTQTTTKDISKTSSVTIKVDDDVSNKKYIGRVSGIPEIMGICGAFCFILLAILVIIGFSITYFVLGILVLVNDKDICDSCTNSHIWAYVLTNVILMYIVKGSYTKNYYNKDNDDDSKIGKILCSVLCCMIIDLGLAIWGSVELNIISNSGNLNSTFTNITSSEYVSCTDLENSNIRTFGLATMILQYISVGIFLIIVVLMGCSVCFINK